MASLCRACLAGDVKMYSLENNILEIYEKLTNSKVSVCGPPWVCYICHSLLHRCCKFSVMAHYSENMLQDLHDKGIEASNKNILPNPSKYYLSHSSVNITDMNNIDGLENSYDPNITVKQELNTTEEVFITIKEEIKVEPIEVEIDPTDMMETTESTDTNEEKILDSEFNESKFIDTNSHTNSCGKQFVEKKELLTHESHNQITYNCDGCDKILFSKRSLSRHVCSNRVKPYTCIECQKTFASKYAMTIHMQIHSEEKPFKCDRCEKKFARKSYLAKHVKAHGDLPAQCYICNKNFSRKVYLKAHVKIHNGLGSFVCNDCDKKFYYKSSLIKHMKIHSNLQAIRPFPCDLCDKSFSFKCGLVNHKMTHTNEKPHACGVCNQKFAQKPNLNVHMRIHTGEKPFACVMCEKRFSLKSVLVNHERTHTGERPYSCDKCHMKFTQRCVLTKHLKKYCKSKLL